MPGFRTRLSNAAWRPCPRRRQCHSFSFAYMGVSWFGLEWGWNETWGLWEHDLFQHFPTQVLTAFSFDICSTHCREYKRFIINGVYMCFFCFLLYVLYSLQALSKRAPSSPTYWSAHSQQWPNMNTPNASNASLTFENRLANRSDMHCYALYCIYCCIRLYPFNSFDFNFTCINSLYFVYVP